MKTIGFRALLTGAGERFHVQMEEDKTVDDLKILLRDTRKKNLCTIDEVDMYLAKRDGQWLCLSDPDVVQLFIGELPGSIRAVMNESNKMESHRLIREFGFPEKGPAYKQNTYVHVIVVPPVHIRYRYQQHLLALRRTYQPSCAEQTIPVLTCGLAPTLVWTWKQLVSVASAVKAAVLRGKSL